MPRMKNSIDLLTKDTTENLIEIVRGNPALYDASLPEYKDASIVKNLWISVAKEMEIDGLTGICFFDYL